MELTKRVGAESVLDGLTASKAIATLDRHKTRVVQSIRYIGPIGKIIRVDQRSIISEYDRFMRSGLRKKQRCCPNSASIIFDEMAAGTGRDYPLGLESIRYGGLPAIFSGREPSSGR